MMPPRFIRMPVFAILILSVMLYMVATVVANQPGIAKDANLKQNVPVSNTAKGANSKDAKVQSQPQAAIGKSIVLPHYQPDFPPGNGKELFISRCGVCHSLRYVTMQPNFPKKTWAKEVDKMIKTYGAHIDKKEADEIIEYLNSIKGKSVAITSTDKTGPEKH